MKFLKRLLAKGHADQGPVMLHLQLPGRIAALAPLILLLFVLLMAADHIRPKNSQTNRKPSPRTVLPDPLAPTLPRQPGPWGHLEKIKIAIERPDEFISVRYSPARWFFPHDRREACVELLQNAGLTTEQRAILLDTNRWQSATNGFYIVPGPEIVLGLSRQARQKIYTVLANHPENFYQNMAFTFRGDGWESWFDQSGLSSETLRIVKGLLYQRGPSICFSDVAEALARIPSLSEKKRLVKTLSRQWIILAKLQVRPDSDLPALVEYWGKYRRAKDISPLLESLAKIPGGATIDIAHLLPPFARMRLYTYPFPTDDPFASGENCYWSTLNFFSESPDHRYSSSDYVRKVLASDYHRIEADPSFGDVVLVSNFQGKPIHSGVYIADGIIFTKNGLHFNQAWVLMELEDVLAVYQTGAPLRVEIYRLLGN